MGHRNPQGLFYDKKNKLIISTEHGPRSGDEINLLEINRSNHSQITNYAWAISFYGEHYSGRLKAELGWAPKGLNPYKNYPLPIISTNQGLLSYS